MEIKKEMDGCFLKLMSIHGKTNVIQHAEMHTRGTATVKQAEDVWQEPAGTAIMHSSSTILLQDTHLQSSSSASYAGAIQL